MLFFASVWSLETAIWATTTHVAYSVAHALAEGHRKLRAIREGLLVGLTPVFALGAVALIIRLLSGSWPRFDIYAQQVLCMSQATDWIKSYDRLLVLWLPLALPAVGVLTLAVTIATRSDPPLKLNKTILIAIASSVLGVGQLVYFVGRTIPCNLTAVSLPLVVLAIILLDAAWTETGRRFSAPVPAWGAVGLLVVSCTVLAGVTGVHLSKAGQIVQANPSFLCRCVRGQPLTLRAFGKNDVRCRHDA
ncbi:MAG: hypothetical protein KatS3mg105_4094 [Gemmatales bacterium]|nr:MAG: hypothetical protein KatS3mg105_4094 [Gemmatales bacterium]